MQPSEVRRRILDDHREIRNMLLSVETLGREVLGEGDGPVRALRLEGEMLLERLLTHMRWEDAYLGPALEHADAWGPERAAALESDHREQRELLRYALSSLRDASRPVPTLARTFVDLVDLLRRDMEDEEQTLLDPQVLRDDVVGIDVETG